MDSSQTHVLTYMQHKSRPYRHLLEPNNQMVYPAHDAFQATPPIQKGEHPNLATSFSIHRHALHQPRLSKVIRGRVDIAKQLEHHLVSAIVFTNVSLNNLNF